MAQQKESTSPTGRHSRDNGEGTSSRRDRNVYANIVPMAAGKDRVSEENAGLNTDTSGVDNEPLTLSPTAREPKKKD